MTGWILFYSYYTWGTKVLSEGKAEDFPLGEIKG
jgi:hypothetical protein